MIYQRRKKICKTILFHDRSVWQEMFYLIFLIQGRCITKVDALCIFSRTNLLVLARDVDATGKGQCNHGNVVGKLLIARSVVVKKF